MPDGNGRGLGTVSYIALPSTQDPQGQVVPGTAGGCRGYCYVALEMHATTNRFRAMLRKTSGFQDEQC